MIIRWCMGVMGSKVMNQGWQTRRSRSETKHSNGGLEARWISMPRDAAFLVELRPERFRHAAALITSK
jgi:hypothetical protein